MFRRSTGHERLPSFQDFKRGGPQPARRIVAYLVLASFVVVFLVLGYGASNTRKFEEMDFSNLEKREFINFLDLFIMTGAHPYPTHARQTYLISNKFE